MSLVVGDNFSLLSKKPLDGRIKYDTLAAMVAMADNTLYEGCIAYCAENDKNYQWKSTNPVDPDTGKWREFSSGGGGETITVDDAISGTSTNPVQNKVIKAALDGKANAADLADVATSGEYADLDHLPDIPEKVSDLTNDSGFIDNTVNNLVNYYTKQQTYTQAEVQALISAAASGGFVVVESLPAEGDAHTIYLVLKSPAGETGDIYDEYIYPGAWEHIGSTSIDLTQYQTKALVNSITVGGVQQTTVEGALAAINALFASYMTTAAFNTAIADYYTKTQADALLNSKTDKVSNATAGNLAGLDANGNLTDSGSKASDFVAEDVYEITGAKNLLDYDALSFVVENYHDKIIGTAYLEPGTYIVSVYQESQLQYAVRNHYLYYKKLPNGTRIDGSNNTSQSPGYRTMEITISEAGTYEIGDIFRSAQATIGEDVTVSQPMVRVAGTDQTWAPYAQTNQYLIKNKQEKQLDTPLTIGGISRTSVEDALGALNSSKQDALAFDDAPTSRSDNPVKSGGIFSVIGALSSLTTTVKTNIVAAINELVTALGGKQDTMSAGTGITLTNSGKTINATNTLPLNYSTSEQVVGTWIDSKPIYQKTINFGALPNNTIKDATHGIINLKTVINAFGMSYNSNKSHLVIPNAGESQQNMLLVVDATKVYIQVYADRSSYANTYVTIQYTKTTD